jgi:hypothetical protein
VQRQNGRTIGATPAVAPTCRDADLIVGSHAHRFAGSKSDLGKVWTCAAVVFGTEDVDGNFVELTHETRLPARASVSFLVRDEGAAEIGVAFWSYTRGQEVYVWNAIDE